MNSVNSTMKGSSGKGSNYSDLRPRISVIGVGGAGGNAVNNMIRSKLEGVDFIVCNTDAQALSHSLSENRIQLGLGATRGLGAGSRPDVGRVAAEEALEDVVDQMKGSHMLFITAGMGGGTGTGAAPVLARAARELGILTVGVVTKPFHFEGAQRMKAAEKGIEELQGFVDTLIVIPNQNLFRVANEKTTFADAFKMADDVLHSGVRGVTDLMIMPGLINLDFADVRSVMGEMGKAMMGTGEAQGERRAIEAAEAAISNPLLDDVSMRGARGVLINITGGPDMTLFEVDEAANRIREEVDSDSQIIFGSTFDESLEGTMRVSVVATGIDLGGVMITPQSSVSSQNSPSSPGAPMDTAAISSGFGKPLDLTVQDGFTSTYEEPEGHLDSSGVDSQNMGFSEEEERASGYSGADDRVRQPHTEVDKPSFFQRLKGFSFGSTEKQAVPTRSQVRSVDDNQTNPMVQGTLPGLPGSSDDHDKDELQIPAFMRRGGGS